MEREGGGEEGQYKGPGRAREGSVSDKKNGGQETFRHKLQAM